MKLSRLLIIGMILFIVIILVAVFVVKPSFLSPAAKIDVISPNGGEVTVPTNNEIIWQDTEGGEHTKITLVMDTAIYRCLRDGHEMCPAMIGWSKVIGEVTSKKGLNSFRWDPQEHVDSNLLESPYKYFIVVSRVNVEVISEGVVDEEIISDDSDESFSFSSP